MPSILIVDDEAGIVSSLRAALGREGYQVEGAASLAEGRARLREAYDFVLLDVAFRDGNGLDLLAEIMTGAPQTAVIMMSGQATIDTAVRATRLGAYDFLEKPISLERLLVLLRNATTALALQDEHRRLRHPGTLPIVGRARSLRRLLEEIERAGPTGARVLIQGEHGTGKELVARAIHAASPRSARPFVAVNCAAIPEELIESELFGHERGAFTGATQARRGCFEEAHGGTLFLDEVGDLSPRAQTKLLRVLQENELTRVGGNRVERLVIMSPGIGIGADEVRAVLPRADAQADAGGRLGEAVREFERRQIESALQAEGGNVTRAAARLGLERSHLYKKMRKLGFQSET